MSRLIRELLDIDEREYSKVVDRLEHVSLRPGVDARLTADVITSTRQKIRSLGLDPSDTTHLELYYGLLAKAAADGGLLRQKYGIHANTTPSKAAEKIADALNPLVSKDKAVCIKPQAVKAVLKSVPPKKTMRALKLRSIDSVLKRENPLLLYALAKRLEEKSWHTQLTARLKRLKANDVTECPLQVLAMPETWMTKLKKYEFDHVVEAVPEIGAILLLPTVPVKTKGSVLLTSAVVMQSAQRLVVDSLPFKRRGMLEGHHTLLPDIAAGLTDEIESLHGVKPTWELAYQLLAERPHILPESEFILSDLNWQSTEMRLASIDTQLDFWVGSHYLASNTDHTPVSFHVIDVAASLVLEKEYGHQVVSHMRASLWNELQLGYFRQDAVERALVRQLTKEELIFEL